jgi:hypothetical protein
MRMVFTSERIRGERQSLDLIIRRRSRRRETLEVVAYLCTVASLSQY